jgi:hypothetical protein
MTKTIVHWTEDMNIQSRHRSSSRAVIRYSSYCTPLVLLTKPFYWVPVEDTNFYKVVIRSRSYIVLVFLLKNHFIVLVLIRSRLIMTKTFMHWTEDMIQSRHRLAQLYGILRIALRSCIWLQPFYWVLVLFTKPFMDNSGINRSLRCRPQQKHISWGVYE